MLATDRPEPTHQAERILAMQRDVVLPSKAGVILVVFYYLFLSDWLYDMPTTRSVVQDTLKDYFLIYVLCNCAGAFFYFWRRLPPGRSWCPDSRRRQGPSPAPSSPGT